MLSKAAAGIFGAMYICASAALFFWSIRRRDWWGLCLPIGAFFQGIGFFFRILVDHYPNSNLVFIFEQLLLVCSPAAYLAFNYILYGRLVVRCIGREFSLIKPERVGRVFVASDVSTFLVQAAGAAMTTGTAQAVGSKIFLVGLILQAISYTAFTALFVHMHRRMHRAQRFSRHQAWKPVLWLLYWTSIFIIIRCIYRVIELALGFNGILWTHEVYFYCFDSTPLFIVIATYVLFWPGAYLEKDVLDPAAETKEYTLVATAEAGV